MAKSAGRTDGGRPTFGVHGTELRHLNVGRINEATFRHLTKLIELPFKRTCKQTRSHGIGQTTCFRGFVLHVAGKRSQIERTGHAGSDKGPLAMVETKLEAKATLSTRAQRTDGDEGFQVLGSGDHQTRVNAAEWDRGFVDENDFDVQHVLVVVVDFHPNRLESGFDGSDARAVLLRHAVREGHAVLECGADGTHRRPSLVSDGRDQSTAATVWCARSTPVLYSAPTERAFQRSRAPNQNHPMNGIR